METCQLTVHFRGICTHFSRIVPGVPHRVVLPDATALRFGGVDLPGVRDTQLYVLLPHFAVVRASDPATRLDMPGVIECGVILDGARLQVANAIGDRVTYDDRYLHVAHLAGFVEFYQFSDEVVLGGRASCYFDVVSGFVAPDFDASGKISGVVITIETDGPPVLTVSPFLQTTINIETAPRRPANTSIALPANGTNDVRLVVANAGPGCDDGADGFDFLLNYLTLKGGIPRRLTTTPPHVTPPPMSVGKKLAEAMKWLALVPTRPALPLPRFDEILVSSTLSCSNTQYP